MKCYKCFDTEDLIIRPKNGTTKRESYVCRVCKNMTAKKRIAKQASYPYELRSTESRKELLRQHEESMERIHTKLAAGGYGV